MEIDGDERDSTGYREYHLGCKERVRMTTDQTDPGNPTELQPHGVSEENARRLDSGGEEAMKVFWELYEELEKNALKDVSAMLMGSGSVAQEDLVNRVMEDARRKAVDGKLLKTLRPGKPEEAAAFSVKPYLKSRVTDYTRGSCWKNRPTAVVKMTGGESEDGEIEIESPVGGYVENDEFLTIREGFPFPFSGDEKLNREHLFFVIQQYPRIIWSGEEKEEEALDQVAEWTGVPREELATRLLELHRHVSSRREAKIAALLDDVEATKTLLKKKTRDEKVYRLEGEGFRQPLASAELRGFFEELRLTEDDCYQNLRRYRDLCKKDGLLKRVLMNRQIFDSESY
jgi:hypothetical protein